MTKFLLHIGYPKTGSTTLQRRVFRFLNCSAIPGRDDLVIRPLYRWVAFGPKVRVDGEQVRLLRSWLSAYPETPKVLSEESILGLRMHLMSRPKRFDKWKPAQKLAVSLDRLGIRPNDVHVVLSIRPQWQWLPSSFAESPPGRDLTRWIERMLQLPLNSAHNPLNFYRVAESFAQVVGQDNMHVLPLHMIGTRQYWEEFTRGTTLEADTLDAIWASNSGIENVRQSAPSAWVSNPRANLRGRLAVNLKEYPLLRRAAVSKWNLPVRGASMVEGWAKPTPSVVLAPELRERIAKVYAESNRQLSSEYGIDLSEGQYW
jgi:hypothetical protein